MFGFLLLSFLPLALIAGVFNDHDDSDSGDEPVRDETDHEAAQGEEIQIEGSDQVTQGTAGDDRITGTDGTDFVFGNAGEDKIFLGDGDDMGEISPEAQAAMDAAQTPGEFIDAYEASGFFGAVGGTGADYIDGGHGDDAITGSQGNDVLRGNLGADTLIDFEGSNKLFGGYGNDTLIATDYDGDPDLLDGGGNDDYLLGNDGDTMTGGDGSDLFGVYWQGDDDPVTVTDFGQLGPSPAPGAAEEQLVIEVDDLADVQNFDVVQSGTGALVTLNGAPVAKLDDVDYAALKAAGGAIYATDQVGSLLPSYA